MLQASHIDLVAGPDRSYCAIAAVLSLAAGGFLWWYHAVFPASMVAVGLILIGYFLLLCLPRDQNGYLRQRYPRATHWWRWAEHTILRCPRCGNLRLYADGSAVIDGEQGRWLAGGWTSRYLVVLRLAGIRRCPTVVISRAINHADDYRRLLVWTRFDPRENHLDSVLLDHS